MKYILIVITFIFGSYLLVASISSDPKEAPAFKASSANFLSVDDIPAEDLTDILDDINFINSENMPKPSSTFRKGHVTKTTIKDYLQQTDYGYLIDLQSTSNVPTPAVHNEQLYVSGGFGSKKYFAFDAFTGENIWAMALDDDGPSSPAIAEGVIVYNTESCTIFACDEETGEQKWSYWLGDPLMSMPSIANGQVFTSYPAAYVRPKNPTRAVKKRLDSLSFNPSHVLISFDLQSGKILWQKWIDGDIMSAPVATGNDLFFTTFTGTLFKVNQQSGEFLSAKQSRATSAPMVTKKGIYMARRMDKNDEEASESVVSMDLQVKKAKAYKAKKAPYLDKKIQDKAELKLSSTALDAGNGFSNGAPANSGAHLAKENIGQSNVSSLQSFQGSRTLNYKGYNYSTQGDELICMHAKSGDSIWSVKLKGDLRKKGGFMGTPPLEVQGHIIIATLQGDILILNAKTGKSIKKYHIDHGIRYQPIVTNGWIYASTTDGKVAAINTQDRKLTGWAMWGGNAARTNISN